jgi:TATA-box binding protein (TBP) (component of TFIID and TFIIIB)
MYRWRDTPVRFFLEDNLRAEKRPILSEPQARNHNVVTNVHLEENPIILAAAAAAPVSAGEPKRRTRKAAAAAAVEKPFFDMMRLLGLLPSAQIKERFGALITPIGKLDRVVAVASGTEAIVTPTFLIFPRGAVRVLFSVAEKRMIYLCSVQVACVGTRSPEAARLVLHELRLLLAAPPLSQRTSFALFSVPNRVCTLWLPFGIDLSRMWSENQADCLYMPEIFPGLFYACEIQRMPEYEFASTTPGGCTDGALWQQATARISQGALTVTMLVFNTGNLVGMGITSDVVRQIAFPAVARVARRYALTAPTTSSRAAAKRLDKNTERGSTRPPKPVQRALATPVAGETAEERTRRIRAVLSSMPPPPRARVREAAQDMPDLVLL